jgi:hypothetical protein
MTKNSFLMKSIKDITLNKQKLDNELSSTYSNAYTSYLLELREFFNWRRLDSVTFDKYYTYDMYNKIHSEYKQIGIDIFYYINLFSHSCNTPEQFALALNNMFGTSILYLKISIPYFKKINYIYRNMSKHLP